MSPSVTDPHAISRYGCHVITAADQDFIRSLTRPQSLIYLDEIQQGLESVCGVFASVVTISRILVHMKISKSSLQNAMKTPDTLGVRPRPIQRP